MLLQEVLIQAVYDAGAVRDFTVDPDELGWKYVRDDAQDFLMTDRCEGYTFMLDLEPHFIRSVMMDHTEWGPAWQQMKRQEWGTQ